MSAAEPDAGGDLELARRILAEGGIEPASAEPSWLAYPAHVADRLGAGLRSGIGGALEGLWLPAEVLLLAARVLVAVVALFLVVALVRALAARWGEERRARPASATPRPEVTPAAAQPPDAPAWRAELRRRLAAGEAEAALEAAWWWLARALAGAAADPGWTGRELLVASGRRELAPLVARWERLAYGPAPATVAGVEELADGLEGALG